MLQSFNVALVTLCLVASHAAQAQTRHALVVGIDSYAHVAPLQKARNDARAVDAALKSAGFQVQTLIDPDRRDLLGGLAEFTQNLQPGDEAVFFFAGHGIEVAGRNVLLAADVPRLQPGDEVLIDSEGLPVDRVLAAIQARGARSSVLIIDACRNNPFPPQGTRSLGGSRGLAPIDPPVGAMVVFSAGTGQEALDRLSEDDPDLNSVFTRKLLPLLGTPGLPMHEAARRLRNEVEDLARSVRHTQRPAIYDEMRGDFVLIPAGTQPQQIEPAPILSSTPVPPAPLAVDPCAAARADWELISTLRDPNVFRTFAAQYQSCALMAALAQSRIAELTRVVAAPAVPNPPQQPPAATPQSPLGTAAPVEHDLGRVQSYWYHNDSVMGLIADGASRRFVYVQPRSALASRGVIRGTVLFDGQRSGNTYQGTARIFRGGTCGSFTYSVSGPVSADQRSVTMYGKAPQVDAACRVTGSIDDRLHFTLR